jgi:hypothetical protein
VAAVAGHGWAGDPRTGAVAGPGAVCGTAGDCRACRGASGVGASQDLGDGRGERVAVATVLRALRRATVVPLPCHKQR